MRNKAQPKPPTPSFRLLNMTLLENVSNRSPLIHRIDTYQEVISHRLFRWHSPAILGSRFKNSVPSPWPPPDHTGSLSSASSCGPLGPSATAVPFFSKLKNCSYVTATVAVIWCGPDSYDARVEHFFEAFHYKLMGASY